MFKLRYFIVITLVSPCALEGIRRLFKYLDLLSEDLSQPWGLFSLLVPLFAYVGVAVAWPEFLVELKRLSFIFPNCRIDLWFYLGAVSWQTIAGLLIAPGFLLSRWGEQENLDLVLGLLAINQSLWLWGTVCVSCTFMFR